MSSLDTEKLWDTHITVKKGDHLYPGAIIAEVPETPAIVHKVMIPPDVEGSVVDVVSDGKYTISDRLLTLQLPDGREKRDHHDPEVAHPGAQTGGKAFSAYRAPDHRPENPGHHVPLSEGRHRRHPRRFRNGKDHDPAPDRQVV